MTALAAVERAAETTAGDALARLRGLVSPLVGPIIGEFDMLLSPEEPAAHVVMCATSLCDVGGADTRIKGSGFGLDRDSAFAAAAGEAVERYAATFVPDDLVLASAAELGETAVAPERFRFFTDEQLDEPGFPAVRFTRDSVVRWTQAVALPSGDDALLPAQLVYQQPPRPDEPTIDFATSNGLACAGSLGEAVVRSMLELCERDAFSIVWSNRLSLPLLDWSDDDELSALVSRIWGRTGLSLAAVDLSRFWELPCVLAVARSPAPDHAPLGVGAACASTPFRALVKALNEASFALSTTQRLREGQPERTFADDGSDVFTFEDHMHFYADRRRAARTTFLDRSRERRRLSDLEPLADGDPWATVDDLCARLEARGASAYLVDVSPPEIRAAGLVVTRVVAPELCPLDHAHRLRHHGVPRLRDEPRRLGLHGLRDGELNDDPHPFP